MTMNEETRKLLIPGKPPFSAIRSKIQIEVKHGPFTLRTGLRLLSHSSPVLVIPQLWLL